MPLIDPRSKFEKISPPEQKQPWPGDQQKMDLVPDVGDTKAAISNFSKAIAPQLIRRGIPVNVVAPGSTWTAL